MSISNPAKMLKESSKKNKILKNKKLKTLELFIANFPFRSIKIDNPSCMWPLYSLGKNPDMNPRYYIFPEKKFNISLIPSNKGLATVYDKEILIFAMSQIMIAINDKEKFSQTIKIVSKQFLETTERGTGTTSYENIEDGLIRLRGTTILTNIPSGSFIPDVREGFGFIESFEISHRHERVYESKEGGIITRKKVEDFTFKLSDWLFNSILACEMTTPDHSYFLIKGVRKRRLYEIVKKHLGKQSSWGIFIETLFRKSGAKYSDQTTFENDYKKYKDALKRYRLEIKKIINDNDLPEIDLTYIAKTKHKRDKLITKQVCV